MESWIESVPPRHAKTMHHRQGPGWWQRAAALAARWALATMLYASVLLVLEAARRRELVRVMGPGGKVKVVPRALAERQVKRGKLRHAPSVDAARDGLGLPPLIAMTTDTDHTHLAGADDAEELR
jgi:hypothetical protein